MTQADINAVRTGLTDEEVIAYSLWRSACRRMVGAKAAYDAAQLEVRDTLQVLANIVAPQDGK